MSPLPLYLSLFVAGIWIADVFALGKPTRTEAALIRQARWGAALSCLLVWIVTPARPEQGFHYSRVVPGGLLAGFLRPLVVIGLFSYSLYLIHQPLIELVHAVTRPLGWPAPVQFLFFQSTVLAGCVALGWLFYRVAERPFLRRSR